MTFPAAKIAPRLWAASSIAQIASIGSDDGLEAGSRCFVDGSLYYLRAVTGANSSSWGVETSNLSAAPASGTLGGVMRAAGKVQHTTINGVNGIVLLLPDPGEDWNALVHIVFHAWENGVSTSHVGVDAVQVLNWSGGTLTITDVDFDFGVQGSPTYSILLLASTGLYILAASDSSPHTINVQFSVKIMQGSESVTP